MGVVSVPDVYVFMMAENSKYSISFSDKNIRLKYIYVGWFHRKMVFWVNVEIKMTWGPVPAVYVYVCATVTNYKNDQTYYIGTTKKNSYGRPNIFVVLYYRKMV